MQEQLYRMKASGSHHPCTVLTKLNEVVLGERHMLPRVNQVLGLLSKERVFAKLDAIFGFQKV